MKLTLHPNLPARVVPALALSLGMACFAPAEEPGVLDSIPASLISADGAEVDRDTAIKGKLVGLYFSAHWCPPCRSFTPQLVEFRNRHAGEFEVVFVSFDRSLEDQLKYMKSAGMAWPAIAMDNDAGKSLAEKFEVRGIPSLVVLGPDGKPLTLEGRNDIARDAEGALAKWKALQ